MFLIILLTVTAYAVDPEVIYATRAPAPRPAPATASQCTKPGFDPLTEWPRPVASQSGGFISASREAFLMGQLTDNWPGEERKAITERYTTRDGWLVGQRGNRVCTWQQATGDALCFEPRGTMFVEVYVGNTCDAPVTYTREEALVILTKALRLDPVEHRRSIP